MHWPAQPGPCSFAPFESGIAGASLVTVWLWICSVPLVAEFAAAPVNLWTGRTLPNFIRFTGLPPWIARRVVAPAKLVGCGLLGVGLGVAPVGAAGAFVTSLISIFYLLRMAAPGRRQIDGLAAFGLTLALSGVVLVLQLQR